MNQWSRMMRPSVMHCTKPNTPSPVTFLAPKPLKPSPPPSLWTLGWNFSSLFIPCWTHSNSMGHYWFQHYPICPTHCAHTSMELNVPSCLSLVRCHVIIVIQRPGDWGWNATSTWGKGHHIVNQEYHVVMHSVL